MRAYFSNPINNQTNEINKIIKETTIYSQGNKIIIVFFKKNYKLNEKLKKRNKPNINIKR